MKILIAGAGAIGAWIGGCIGRSGDWVTLVDRPSISEAIQSEGLRVQLPGGQSWQTNHFMAAPSITQALQTDQRMYQPPYDAVFLCVKAYSVREVVAELQQRRESICKPDAAGKPRTLFVCFQNGVGSEETVAEVFGADRVVAMTTTSPISVLSPGAIRVGRAGGALALAAMRRQDQPDLSLLCDLLKRTELPFRVYDDYRALRWSKLMLNMLGNASAAILDMPAGEVYADARLFHFEMRMLREAIAVMRGLGVRAIDLPRFPAALLATAARLLPDGLLQPILRRQLAGGRGEKRPSFYYDLARRTGQSEVGYLNGAVVKYGRELGIATPVNERLTTVLTALVRGEQQPDDWRGQIDKLSRATWRNVNGPPG